MDQVDIKINKHFIPYLNHWDNRFYFVVGGYGSSKSYNTAIKIILKILSEPKRKVLVVRDVFATIKESCYDVLKEVVYMLDLEKYFRFKSSPLAIECKNGSRIIFKGLDKESKLKSINDVSIIWVEEATDIGYKAFKELNGRLRTFDQSMHIIMTQNPISKQSWCYNHFFKTKYMLDEKKLYKERIIDNGQVYYHHSTVDDNRFIPDEYLQELEDLKSYDPYLYDVARKGYFGVLGTRVLPQVELMEADIMKDKINNLNDGLEKVGMDFGFETSFNAVIRCTIDQENKYLYIDWEYYKNKQTDDITASEPELQQFKIDETLIVADSAEPKTIKYFSEQGFLIRGAVKVKRIEQIRKVKRFKKIFISTSCPNCWGELNELSYKEDRNGNMIPDQFNIDPHTFNITGRV
ncbi:MAG: PBSX family phage terminase large subunit [Cetobacterium sp.]